MTRSGRIGWIEWARALGACSVAMLHVFVSTALAADVGLARQSVYAVLGIVLGRWAVPAFFMVSGYLLLDPARDFGWSRAKTHARRMVLVVATFGVAFSLMEEAWACVAEGRGLSPWVIVLAVRDVLGAASWDHLWYVYALIFVYLLAPGVRGLRARIGAVAYGRTVLALFASVMVVPTLLRLGVVLGGGAVCVPTGGYGALVQNVAAGLACFCVGDKLREWRLGPVPVALGAGSLGAMLAVTLWGMWVARTDCAFVFLQGSCFACTYAVLVLLALRRFVGEGPVASGGVVDVLARESFGIYVLHPLFVHLVLLACSPLDFAPGAFELLFLVGVLGASLAATRVVRRLPVVGELL